VAASRFTFATNVKRFSSSKALKKTPAKDGRIKAGVKGKVEGFQLERSHEFLVRFLLLISFVSFVRASEQH